LRRLVPKGTGGRYEPYGRGGVAAVATVLASMLAISRRAKALGLTIPESFLPRAD
jgi:hypothetical protein